MIANEFLRFLKCPNDSTMLIDRESSLDCPTCHTSYPVTGGIPRFVPDDKYVGSFSHEWLTWEETVIDAEAILRGGFGLTPEFVRGKWILDAGCGAGRFTEVFSRWGANVVAVDLSRAVEACARNVEGRENVLVVQADLLSLPFVEKSFDIIYSNGVLHHSSDTREAFRSVSRLAKDGGYTTIYVYSDYGNSVWLDRWRAITPKLPYKVLTALCYASVPAYYARQVPGLSLLATALYKVFPMSTHKIARERVLLTFDLYSAKYRFRHTYPEVYQWFIECGYTDIQLFETQIIVAGWMDRSKTHRASPSPATIDPKTVPITTDRRDSAYLAGRRGLD